MPELPDVEVYRRYLSATSLHQRIEHVHAESPELLKGTSPQGLGRLLHGQAFEAANRHGKYLLAELSNGRYLVLHFGMSGGLWYFQSGKEDTPEYTQCLFAFENGFNLAYTAPRKLGLIEIVESPAALVEEKQLGPDALDLGPGDLEKLAADRRGCVKSWLMDQSVIAGIGNIYSDEILFQSGIHPQRAVRDLGPEAIRTLHRALHQVVEAAVEVDADPEAMPSDFLLPHREEGGRCPRCSQALKADRVAGRTAWYCPRCQAA